MTKTKKPAKAGPVDVRVATRWLSDIASNGCYPWISLLKPGISYATDGHMMGFCKAELDSHPSNQAGPEFFRALKTKRQKRLCNAETLARFAFTRKRLPEPVYLFGVPVDRVRLNRLLRRAPETSRLEVLVGGDREAILIRSPQWFAYLMPYVWDEPAPRFNRTVSK